MDIIIKGHDLLIPGEQIAANEGEELCFVGIQKQTHLSKSLWTIGNVILKKYMIVYDLTPSNERHKNYIQVGIAPKNPDYDIEWVPPPPPEPVKPDPVVVPTIPEDTTPKQPKTPETVDNDDQQEPKEDDTKPDDQQEIKPVVIPHKNTPKEEVAETVDKYEANPILDGFLNNLSVIAFLISFEVMQFFKANVLGLFKH